MIRRLILSLLVIIGISGTAFLGTKAALSSQVTLTTNTFSTGTVGLQISKSTSTSPTSFTDVSVAGFTGKFLPGQKVSEPVWMRNSSSDVDFSLAAQVASVSGEIAPADVIVTFTPVASDGTDNGGTSVSANLNDWLSPISLGNIIGHNNGKQRFRMDLELASGVSTTGSINFDFIFTGTQTP